MRGSGKWFGDLPRWNSQTEVVKSVYQYDPMYWAVIRARYVNGDGSMRADPGTEYEADGQIGRLTGINFTTGKPGTWELILTAADTGSEFRALVRAPADNVVQFAIAKRGPRKATCARS